MPLHQFGLPACGGWHISILRAVNFRIDQALVVLSLCFYSFFSLSQCHWVLGLIFVKYISDTFAARRAELVTRLTNPADDYFYHDAQPGDTFTRNQYPDLRADFILANPPFNISDWWHASLTGDARWVYGDPPPGNANYAWLQHMLHHLKPTGRAGIVLANGSMSSSQNSEGQIRAAMVEADVVEVMVALPGQLFFNTQIPACLWFLVKQKTHRKGQVLFIDARKQATMISRVQSELTDAVIERIAATVAAWRGSTSSPRTDNDSVHPELVEPRTDNGSVHPELVEPRTDNGSVHPELVEGFDGHSAYQDIPGFCRSVPLAEIAQHGHVLTPGRYVGAEEVEDNDEDFATKMQQLTEKLGEQMTKGAELDQLIRTKLGGLGYEF